ncbi:MAG TPA: hypothetical protein VN764_00910 [Polyangiaceae bacterium]|nr:hypothetical protein [Polyangiaceae bacterium]
MVAALTLPSLLAGLWIAVHSIPWMGPLVANSLRATIGKDNVTRLEDFVYAVEDRINRAVKSGDRPRTYWKVPQKAPARPAQPTALAPTPTPPSLATPNDSAPPAPLVFQPRDPGPAHPQWSAEGDGQWVAMLDPRRPEEPARMYKTLLHADSSRSWSELFIVAVDLRQVAVMPVMGYQEPRTEKPEAAGYTRHAKIPAEHYEALLGAFNGGFMAEHGGYGVYFDGITFLDPKDEACTLVALRDGSYAVGSWTKLKERLPTMLWYRQAPACMYEEGQMHPFLKVHQAKKWGATLDGNTVIRRSAVGLSADGQILYVGISNHTTAKVMASGMHHAGAAHVAQMDVNWSYPKFVTYELDKDGQLYPVALAEGFEFSNKLYLRERSMRDFFYLARREMVQGDLDRQLAKLPASTPAPLTPSSP